MVSPTSPAPKLPAFFKFGEGSAYRHRDSSVPTAHINATGLAGPECHQNASRLGTLPTRLYLGPAPCELVPRWEGCARSLVILSEQANRRLEPNNSQTQAANSDQCDEADGGAEHQIEARSERAASHCDQQDGDERCEPTEDRHRQRIADRQSGAEQPGRKQLRNQAGLATEIQRVECS